MNIESIINVIFPEEVIPSISFNINGSNTLDPNCKVDDLICKIIGDGVFNEDVIIDYIFSTNNQTSENTIFEAVLNEDQIAIKNPIVKLKKEIFNQANNIKLSYINKDSDVIELPFKEGSEDLNIQITDEVIKVIITFDTLIANADNLVSIKGKLDKGILKEHDIYAYLETYQGVPYEQTLSDEEYGLIKIKLPLELNPEVDTQIYYGSSEGNKVSYESIFTAKFSLDTFNVQSPISTYTIELDKASGLNNLAIEQVNIENDFVENVKYYNSINKEYTSFDKNNDIVKIVIEFKDIETISKKLIATVNLKANIQMGETQGITATFKGSQNEPFFEEKTAFDTEIIEVVDTKTKVLVEGVNQVTKELGVGNDYSVSIYKHWNRGYIYSQEDYTLDQGYKSLGGFTNTLTRPTEKYENNNQRVTITTNLPDHFDLYYMRIRDEAKDYLNKVNIYRMVNGKETLWQEIDGSLWTNNTLENNMWRINTALYENSKDALFSSHSTTDEVYEHPYFKSAWHDDVNPEYPISKVEVILDFTRLSEDEIPQMSGRHDDIIEYMGRFFKTSSKKEETVINSDDIFGITNEIKRNDTNTINSLVGYSYAEASTGVYDKTSTKVKEIEMGQNGEYLIGLSNKETFRVPYYGGHGPDVYIPTKTEHDEWLQMYDSGFFHDTLTQEFIYPNNINDDKTYHYDS